MAVSVKDLRYRTKEVLMSLKRGEKPIITFRGTPIARIVPLTSSDKKEFYPVGYGMWSDHPEMKDVNPWLDAQRSPRYRR